MKRELRDKHLKRFNHVYYSEKHLSKKIDTLPYWMDSYGYWLNKEDENNLPKYYRRFRAGTVVMVDFGVRIGSEISQGHFALVLSKKDSIYNRNLIVVPLSSKDHRKQNYLPLGDALFSNILIHFQKQISLLRDKLMHLSTSIKNVPSELDINFSNAEIDFLKAHNLDIHSFNKNLEMENYQNSGLYHFIKQLKNVSNHENINSIKLFIKRAETIFTQADKINMEVKQIDAELSQLTILQEKVAKYNKNTFVDVANIQAISKLRIKKFSAYNISENIIFHDAILKRVKDRLMDFI